MTATLPGAIHWLATRSPGDVTLASMWPSLHADCKPTSVYLIQAGAADGTVKIGVAEDVQRRLEMLQVGNHEPLTLLAHEPCCQHVERFLHVHFARHRLRGEWFAHTADLDDLAGYVNAGRDATELAHVEELRHGISDFTWFSR